MYNNKFDSLLRILIWHRTTKRLRCLTNHYSEEKLKVLSYMIRHSRIFWTLQCHV